MTKPNFFPRILPNLSLFLDRRFFLPPSVGLSVGVKRRGLNLVCLQQQGVGPHADQATALAGRESTLLSLPLTAFPTATLMTEVQSRVTAKV